MAKKQKPFAILNTKEEFDKCFNRVYESGRKQGFKEGRIWALSYFNELISDIFTPQEIMEAESETRDRHIEKWRREKKAVTLKDELDFKHSRRELAQTEEP